jgi:hypothetical protein
MYVEISPRQSGKTTRLVNAASTFLRENQESTIAIVSHNRRNSENIKQQILTRLEMEISWQQGMDWPDDVISRSVHTHYKDRIQVRIHTCIQVGYYPPDYWFFDEFAFIRLGDLFPGPAEHNDYNRGNRMGWGNQIVTNAYYCTTPSDRYGTVDTLVRWCEETGQIINFNNPWTEERLREHNALGPYMRDAVLGDWVEYMTSHGFPIKGIKENWIVKHIKTHKFING